MNGTKTTQTYDERDMKVTSRILAFLDQRNPFSSDTCLWSIATGTVGNSAVNVDNSKSIGINIL